MASSQPAALLLHQRSGRLKISHLARGRRRWDHGRRSSVSAVRITSYFERDSGSIGGLVSKVIGSLPVVGLVVRILSDEGGVGEDIVDFAEFRRKVGKNCSVNESRAFYEFRERRGRSGDPLYVLMSCWLAAVGAGLLKSEEILEGMARLRISNDIEFEEQNFMAIMIAAREKRAKLKSTASKIPMENRAEKALEAIYVCSYGQDTIENEEEERLLSVMLSAVFPSVGEEKINRIVKTMVEDVNKGERMLIREPTRLPKEAVDVQMKDLQFLKQWNASETEGAADDV